jgi:tRNA(Ser,Leu) C12 N-acetylase TAN1
MRLSAAFRVLGVVLLVISAIMLWRRLALDRVVYARILDVTCDDRYCDVKLQHETENQVIEGTVRMVAKSRMLPGQSVAVRASSRSPKLFTLDSVAYNLHVITAVCGIGITMLLLVR